MATANTPGFNINNFKAEIIKKGGYLRPNKFLMTFAAPTSLTAALKNLRGFDAALSATHSMEFWCESINLPGYMLGTHPNKRYGYGPDEKRPAFPIFGPLSATFNADSNGDYITFFNSWMNAIAPHTWYNSFNESINGYGGNSYEVAYKSDIITDMLIVVFDDTGKKATQYTVKEAFPTHVFDIPLNWNDTNSIMKFQVNFEYFDWVERKD